MVADVILISAFCDDIVTHPPALTVRNVINNNNNNNNNTHYLTESTKSPGQDLLSLMR